MILNLSEKQGIELEVIMADCKDKILSYNGVCQLYKAKYTGPTTRTSIAYRILIKFE